MKTPGSRTFISYGFLKDDQVFELALETNKNFPPQIFRFSLLGDENKLKLLCEYENPCVFSQLQREG